VKSENMIPMPISGWFTKYIYLMIPSVDQVRRWARRQLSAPPTSQSNSGVLRSRTSALPTSIAPCLATAPQKMLDAPRILNADWSVLPDHYAGGYTLHLVKVYTLSNSFLVVIMPPGIEKRHPSRCVCRPYLPCHRSLPSFRQPSITILMMSFF